MKARLLLVLHAHLPYVRHIEQPCPAEEAWLHEAVWECYLPLLGALEETRAPLTISLSPTLIAMLDDPGIRQRTSAHLQRLAALAHATGAALYKERAEAALALYESKYRRDIVDAFAGHARAGRCELITTSATHAYLPNLAPAERAVRAQIRIGRRAFINSTGVTPLGLWLPECGYYDGLDRIIRDEGYEYTFLEAHGLLHAEPRPALGVYAPARTPGGLAVFGRDALTARMVWSAEEGYPGDASYRDFHRDLAHEKDTPHLREFFLGESVRFPTGIKQYNIAGGAYDAELAGRKAREHAHDFVERLAREARDLQSMTGEPPLFVAPFDAELFGHWWFEGPVWLRHLLDALSTIGEIEAVTPDACLKGRASLDTVRPGLSSWGAGGYGAAWAEAHGGWIASNVLRASRVMETMAQGGERQAQALIELLLMQSGDWGFLLTRGQSSDYALGRVREHLDAFYRLAEGADTRYAESRRGRWPLWEGLDAGIY